MFQQKPTFGGLLTRVKGPQKHMDKTRVSEHKRGVATGDVRNANATHWMKTATT